MSLYLLNNQAIFYNSQVNINFKKLCTGPFCFLLCYSHWNSLDIDKEPEAKLGHVQSLFLVVVAYVVIAAID